jgi:hypothetical protein
MTEERVRSLGKESLKLINTLPYGDEVATRLRLREIAQELSGFEVTERTPVHRIISKETKRSESFYEYQK